ncbi:MAG: GFA family protein [Gammaproteobacteria bacterium]|nr:GFA family protein [Gammaproteobacteria bacterium]
MTIKGSCLCQSVKYELSDAEFYPVTNCHCPNCRKVSGVAYGTYLAVKQAKFRWLMGEDLVTKYESSPETYRSFCSRCGSPLAAFDGEDIRCITLGSTDGDIGKRPESHIYVSDKAPWFEITDNLPQHELRSPDTRPQYDPSSD